MDTKNKFETIMSEMSDYDLVQIVTWNRVSYEQEALKTAEIEISKRNINVNDFIQSHKEKIQKEATKNDIESQAVSSGLRFIHMLIDGILATITMCLSFVIPFLMFKAIPVNSSEFKAVTTCLFMGLGYLGYYILMEYKFQKTVGKFITGTMVVNLKGEKPTFTEIVIRTFCRFIPFDRLSFLFLRNGIHDNFSKTVVIKDIPKDKKVNKLISIDDL
jgi:uncharacterized RDD family membrane protein YckC